MHDTKRRPHPIAAGWIAAIALAGCTGVTSPSPLASPSGAGTPSPSALASQGPSPSVAPSFGPLTAVRLEPVASGLTDPIGVTHAGDGSGRLFVNERGGRVRIVNPDGTLGETVFVDLTDRIQAGGERGLLGVAFDPDFAANGRVFVHYSRLGDGATVIAELTASADRSTADAGSERILFTHDQPFANHNGGQIAFGPDGYLYIGLGDGGSGGDPLGNGQNRDVLLGKILRIDVNAAPADGKQYAIPSTNPYAAGGATPGEGQPEIWAYGLRNPWRFSFDRDTGDLYIGDVGQGSWEEIDRQPGASVGGENYGWNFFEGSHCYNYCDVVTAMPPVAEYSHGDGSGCAVTGGYVYRGLEQPAMLGTYLFSDYCTGTIWTLAADGGLSPRVLAESELNVTSFGEDEDGEMYLVDISGGGLYRVVAI